MYYRVIPFQQSFDTYGLIYSSKKDTNYTSGTILEVPYGKNTQLAVCYGTINREELNCDPKDIKEII